MSPDERWSTINSRVWGYNVRRPDSDPVFMAVRAHRGTPHDAAIPFGPDSLNPTREGAVQHALTWLAGNRAEMAGPLDPDLWMYGVVFDMDSPTYPNPIAEWIDPSYLR